LILVCYVAYTAKYLTHLLKSTEVIQIWEFDNLHMTQCAKIIFSWIHGKYRQRFLSNVYKRFFLLIFISTFITSTVSFERLVGGWYRSDGGEALVVLRAR